MASYEVNPAAVTRCRELIAARQYVLDSDWGDAQPSAADTTAYLERHSWEEYAGWHLGLTVGANDETKARYAFVYGDLRRVHRTGLIACVYRAAEWRHKAVELAAHDLLQQLDAKARHRPDLSAALSAQLSTRTLSAARDGHRPLEHGSLDAASALDRAALHRARHRPAHRPAALAALPRARRRRGHRHVARHGDHYFTFASCGDPVDRAHMHSGQVALVVQVAVVALPWLVAGLLTRWRAPFLVLGALCTGYAAYFALQGMQVDPWTDGFCF